MKISAELAAERERGAPSLGVWTDVADYVLVVFNFEIESPILVDASLPNVAGLIVFLGMEGGVAQVSLQEGELLMECFCESSQGHRRPQPKRDRT